MCSTGDIMTAVGVIAAPFTGGASLSLAVAGQQMNAAERQAEEMRKQRRLAEERQSALLQKQQAEAGRIRDRGLRQQAQRVRSGAASAAAASRGAQPFGASPLGASPLGATGMQNAILSLNKPKLGG